MRSDELILEVQKWRTRRSHTPDFLIINSKIKELLNSWNCFDPACIDFSDFFIVRAVTLLETFLRDAVRTMCDHSHDIFVRSNALFQKNIKIDFQIIEGLQGKRVTVGDIIARSLSFGNTSHIVSIFESLMCVSSLKESLRSVVDRGEAISKNTSPEPIINDVDEVFSLISKIFNLRNIVVHENPAEKPYSMEEVEGMLNGVSTFVNAMYWHVSALLYGDFPLTQLDMNLAAQDRLDEATNAMHLVLDQILKLSDCPNVSLLQKAQAAWEKFAAKEASLHADIVRGGSMEPLAFATTKEELTSQRISQLSWWLKRKEEF